MVGVAGGNKNIKNITSDVVEGSSNDKSWGADSHENASQRDSQSYADLYFVEAENNLAGYQHMESQKRTDKWVDNPKDLKKRKEEERFRKFEKEELERRKIDEQERIFQAQNKEK